MSRRGGRGGRRRGNKVGHVVAGGASAAGGRNGGSRLADQLTEREKTLRLNPWVMWLPPADDRGTTDANQWEPRCLCCLKAGKYSEIDALKKYMYWDTAHARGNKCKRWHIDETTHDPTAAKEAGLEYMLSSVLKLRETVREHYLPTGVDGESLGHAADSTLHPFFHSTGPAKLERNGKRRSAFLDIQTDLAKLSSRTFSSIRNADRNIPGDVADFDGESEQMKREEEERYARIIFRLREYDPENEDYASDGEEDNFEDGGYDDEEESDSIDRPGPAPEEYDLDAQRPLRPPQRQHQLNRLSVNNPRRSRSRSRSNRRQRNNFPREGSGPLTMNESARGRTWGAHPGSHGAGAAATASSSTNGRGGGDGASLRLRPGPGASATLPSLVGSDRRRQLMQRGTGTGIEQARQYEVQAMKRANQDRRSSMRFNFDAHPRHPQPIAMLPQAPPLRQRQPPPPPPFLRNNGTVRGQTQAQMSGRQRQLQQESKMSASSNSRLQRGTEGEDDDGELDLDGDGGANDQDQELEQEDGDDFFFDAIDEQDQQVEIENESDFHDGEIDLRSATSSVDNHYDFAIPRGANNSAAPTSSSSAVAAKASSVRKRANPFAAGNPFMD